jgi:hypothetical protein
MGGLMLHCADDMPQNAALYCTMTNVMRVEPVLFQLEAGFPDILARNCVLFELVWVSE